MPRLFWTALWFRKLQQSPINTLGSLMTRLLYNSDTLSSQLSLDVSTIAQTLSASIASIYKWSLLSQGLNTFCMSGFNLSSWMKLFNKSCPLSCTNTSIPKVKCSLMWAFPDHPSDPAWARSPRGGGSPSTGDVRTWQSHGKEGSEALPARGLQPSWKREKGTITQEGLGWFGTRPPSPEQHHWPHPCSIAPAQVLFPSPNMWYLL